MKTLQTSPRPLQTKSFRLIWPDFVPLLPLASFVGDQDFVLCFCCWSRNFSHWAYAALHLRASTCVQGVCAGVPLLRRWVRLFSMLLQFCQPGQKSKGRPWALCLTESRPIGCAFAIAPMEAPIPVCHFAGQSYVDRRPAVLASKTNQTVLLVCCAAVQDRQRPLSRF